MSNQASVSDISSFLANAKKLIAAGNYVFVPRGKNMQALSDHGFTVRDAKDEILGLMTGDYFKGRRRILIKPSPETSGSLRKMLMVNSFM